LSNQGHSTLTSWALDKAGLVQPLPEGISKGQGAISEAPLIKPTTGKRRRLRALDEWPSRSHTATKHDDVASLHRPALAVFAAIRVLQVPSTQTPRREYRIEPRSPIKRRGGHADSCGAIDLAIAA